MMTKKVSRLSKLVIVFILWGSQHPALKVLAEEVPPFLFNSVKFLIAAFVLFFFVRKRSFPRGSALMRLAVLGFTGISCYGILSIVGIKHSTATNSSVILNCHPVLAVLLGVVVLKERLSPVGMGGVLVGFLGTLIVVGGGGLQSVYTNQHLVVHLVSFFT